MYMSSYMLPPRYNLSLNVYQPGAGSIHIHDQDSFIFSIGEASSDFATTT